MTDSFAFQACPKCGKENLAHMTHCVHCGAELEELFHFEGQIEVPEGNLTEDSLLTLPFMADEFASPAKDEKAGKESDEPADADKADPEDLDWLERVRNRARIEEDASGELTKGINSMQESVEDRSSDAEKQYQAWLEEVREQAEREKARQAERLQPSPVDEDGVPEWLRRIRALHPSNAEEENTENADDEWTDEALEELRRRELGEDYVPPENPIEEEDLENVSDSGDAEEATQEIPIEHNIPEDDESDAEEMASSQKQTPKSEPDLSGELEDGTGFVMVGDPKLNPDEVFDTPGLDGKLTPEEGKPREKRGNPQGEQEKEAILQDLVILRGQHEKVALLKSLISDEGKPVIPSSEPPKKNNDWSRLIIGLAFIFVILLAIIFMPHSAGEKTQEVVPQKWFGHYLDDLEKSDKVLVVMSYYSASAPELEALAAPVLEQFENKGLDWYAVTLRMDGLWQAASLYEKAGLEDAPEPEYLPGGQFAMLDLAVKPDGAAGQGMQNPSPEFTAHLKDYDLVLLITDSALSIRGWLEQVSPNTDFIKTLVIISHKEMASIQPYFDSAQVLGILYGNHGLKGNIPGSGNQYRAYQVGMGLMIVLMAIGLFLALRQTAQKKTSSGDER